MAGHGLRRGPGPCRGRCMRRLCDGRRRCGRQRGDVGQGGGRCHAVDGWRDQMRGHRHHAFGWRDGMGGRAGVSGDGLRGLHWRWRLRGVNGLRFWSDWRRYRCLGRLGHHAQVLLVGCLGNRAAGLLVLQAFCQAAPQLVHRVGRWCSRVGRSGRGGGWRRGGLGLLGGRGVRGQGRCGPAGADGQQQQGRGEACSLHGEGSSPGYRRRRLPT
jgi:hypothetical protein